jgi:hypothetical protein
MDNAQPVQPVDMASKRRGGAKPLATKFLRIFRGNYFGFSAGNPIFATRSKSRLAGNLKSGFCRGKVRSSPVVGKRMVR